jgi:hypothetical protein
MNHSHQEGLFDPAYAQKTIVLGAGSVGGFVPYWLANMGVKNIESWDDDVVASHNVPMSIYGLSDIGRKKVVALLDIIENKTGVRICIVPKRYTGQFKFRQTCVVSCVDEMKSRKAIWKQVKWNPTVPLFCDTRVAEHYIEVLAIAPNDPKDIARYEMLLYGDKEAVQQTCGNHGTILIASRAANIAAQSLTTFWQTGQKKWRTAERCDTLARVF